MVYGLLVFMNMNVLCTALAIKHIFRRSGYAEEEGSTLMLLEGEIGVEVGGSELGGDRHEGAGTA